MLLVTNADTDFHYSMAAAVAAMYFTPSSDDDNDHDIRDALFASDYDTTDDDTDNNADNNADGEIASNAAYIIKNDNKNNDDGITNDTRDGESQVPQPLNITNNTNEEITDTDDGAAVVPRTINNNNNNDRTTFAHIPSKNMIVDANGNLRYAPL